MSAYNPDKSASRRLTAFVLFVVGVSLTISLFYVKTRAQTAKQQVVSLERAISDEEAAIAVLEAELAYRKSPERLSTLSREHLGLAPIKADATVSLDEIVEILPLNEASEEGDDG